MRVIRNRELIGYIFILITSIGFFCSSHSFAFTEYWPTNGWRKSSPEEQGMHSKAMADMVAFVKDHEFNIDSISIIRNGYIVVDASFYPFSKDQKHFIHSCTKSIMSALIGIAIDKGYIKDVKQNVMEFFSNRTFSNLDEYKRSITLENLLTMTSGLKCRDTGWYDWEGLNDMKKSIDWMQYVLDLPMEAPPGELFVYCNGVSYLLSAIIQKTTNMQTIDFARKHLFGPLGISDIRWDTSPQGIGIGWGTMWLKPHDMAKFGWLYLNKGRWENKQIISSEWVEVSTQGHMDAKAFVRYGYHWWVDSSGYYIAVGANGQFIFVIPDKNIVAVFTGDLSGRSFSFIPNRLLNTYVIPAAASRKPLPSNPEQKTRLDHIISSISQPRAFIWTSEKDGVAKEGVFKRTTPPSFQFNYPLGSKKTDLKAHMQIMRMDTPDKSPFGAILIDIPNSMKLEDIGPVSYGSWLKSVGCSNIKVISNKEITLQCKTEAYRSDFTWLWKNGIPMTTLLVSAYKNNKVIGLFVHTSQNPEDVASIVQSLTFK